MSLPDSQFAEKKFTYVIDFTYATNFRRISGMALSTEAKLGLKWVGRAVFFVLLLTQWSFLTAFIASYQKPAWSAVVIAYLPVVMLWIWLLDVLMDH